MNPPPPAASPIPLLRLLLAAMLLALLCTGLAGGAIFRAGGLGPFAAAVFACGFATLLPAFGLTVASLRRADACQRALAERREVECREPAETSLRQLPRIDAVGPLTRGIAHDFNNHLTAISSNVELLARRLPAGDASLLRLADAAMQGVRRAAALSHRLLSLSRRQATDPEALDLGRLAEAMCPLLRRMLGESIRVETQRSEGLWLVWADANQFEATLLHLVANAQEGMPQGGTLTIAVGNLALEPGDADLPPGQYVTLSVSATGPDFGLAAGEPRLAAASAFALQFHGLLRQTGRSSVRLHFPRYLPRPAQPLPAVAAPADSGGETILVVEDDDSVRHSAVEALRQIGYTVLEAPDAMQGFRLIADRGGIDLLFADIGLPGGVDGRALADAARNVAPELKVLFTTGYSPATGDPLLLPKPFSLDQLAAKVRQALRAAAPEPVLAGASACPALEPDTSAPAR